MKSIKYFTLKIDVEIRTSVHLLRRILDLVSYFILFNSRVVIIYVKSHFNNTKNNQIYDVQSNFDDTQKLLINYWAIYGHN